MSESTEGVSPEQSQGSKEKFCEAVDKLLTEKQFSLPLEANEAMQKQIDGGSRFVCIVGTHTEGNEEVERFLKIPIEVSERINASFRRQILVGKFLKEDGQVKTRGVVAHNLDPEKGLPFAIMETFGRNEARIGFIANPEDIELLTAREAQSCVETLGQLHSIDSTTVPEDVRKTLQPFSGSTEEFFDAILKNLDKTVRALDADGREEFYYQVLNRRLGVPNFREKVVELLDVFRDIIKEEEGEKRSFSARRSFTN